MLLPTKGVGWIRRKEIEIGIMIRQCLDRRLPDQDALKREIKAWQDKRNQEGICVNWRFTTQDARVKLKSLYPTYNFGRLLGRLSGFFIV